MILPTLTQSSLKNNLTNSRKYLNINLQKNIKSYTGKFKTYRTMAAGFFNDN